MRIVTRRLPAALPLVLCLLLASGCDKGPEQLRDAEAQYQALVDKGVPPTNPAWDAVVAALEAVPRDSKARPEAEQRLAAIRGVRGRLPPRPLATPGATGPGTDEADAKRAACEALAKRLGQTQDDTAREPLKQALEQCRADLVRLEARSHPAGEHGHEHGGAPAAPAPGPADGGDPR
ncbi:hypothetical protein [Pyxidicoccus xibeiensis]|uniref:hypothetical protein n=1 Tax=Pyxidicoccus xibeiensis TaxID=2906759 RepID=UPI0020A789D0|nr:hypothetical protein [Pyxidicoccus xibeiensis]MCP3139405.1 hypothetical protein [Pyxidicoccus xibeiensis]